MGHKADNIVVKIKRYQIIKQRDLKMIYVASVASECLYLLYFQNPISRESDRKFNFYYYYSIWTKKERSCDCNLHNYVAILYSPPLLFGLNFAYFVMCVLRTLHCIRTTWILPRRLVFYFLFFSSKLNIRINGGRWFMVKAPLSTVKS